MCARRHFPIAEERWRMAQGCLRMEQRNAATCVAESPGSEAVCCRLFDGAIACPS